VLKGKRERRGAGQWGKRGWREEFGWRPAVRERAKRNRKERREDLG
jgi:hypothetical protein